MMAGGREGAAREGEYTGACVRLGPTVIFPWKSQGAEKEALHGHIEAH